MKHMESQKEFGRCLISEPGFKQDNSQGSLLEITFLAVCDFGRVNCSASDLRSSRAGAANEAPMRWPPGRHGPAESAGNEQKSATPAGADFGNNRSYFAAQEPQCQALLQSLGRLLRHGNRTSCDVGIGRIAI